MMFGLLLVCACPGACEGFTAPLELRQRYALLQNSFPLSATKRHRSEMVNSTTSLINRRDALVAGILLSAAVTAAPSTARADVDSCGLEDMVIGNGRWINTKRVNPAQSVDTLALSSFLSHDRNVPATFSTYAARFLLHYDDGVSSWWKTVLESCSLLSDEGRCDKVGACFGCLARSIQIAIETSIQGAPSVQKGYQDLMSIFLQHYGNDKEARRHIGLLFAMLPHVNQPTKLLEQVSSRIVSTNVVATTGANMPPPAMMKDFTVLFPPIYECAHVRGTDSFTIYPPISLYENTIKDDLGRTAVRTAIGPLGTLPLQRERPHLSSLIYALFGISGAAGCALTHTVVIPLDVVKTRMQTDGQLSGESMLDSASSILQKEGMAGFVLGLQATIVGYIWYGLSVYPSYAFFKRWIGQSLLRPEFVMIHTNEIALCAGALSAVIASLGLTPVEAARIRTVADPDVYRSKGLIGTLQSIASEDSTLGWKNLYAGFPSLVTRQVIFGSVKFLAFERACEAIFHTWPFLHDETWTSLMVSLVAGGFSGCLSSVVSQPADSLLTYVAQNSNVGLLEGSRIMVEKEGVGSLYRGLGSRCVWAGSIIAGQFLLYDVFRTYFGVNTHDLSQVFEIVISPG